MCYTCRSPDSRNIQSWKLKKESKTGEWIWIWFSFISYDTNKSDSFCCVFFPVCSMMKFRLSASVTSLIFWWLIKDHFQYLLHLVKSLSGSQQALYVLLCKSSTGLEIQINYNEEIFQRSHCREKKILAVRFISETAEAPKVNSNCKSFLENSRYEKTCKYRTISLTLRSLLLNITFLLPLLDFKVIADPSKS